MGTTHLHAHHSSYLLPNEVTQVPGTVRLVYSCPGGQDPVSFGADSVSHSSPASQFTPALPFLEALADVRVWSYASKLISERL